MNRKQFIASLSRQLSQLSLIERKEIISFYEDRFNNAIYEGKSEEDVILELESPEEISKNVLTEYGIERKYSERKVEATSILGILFFDLFVSSWLLPVIIAVPASLSLSWFSYFFTFEVFFKYSFGVAMGAFLISTGVFMVYLVFIVYLVIISAKLVISIFNWHVRVFTGDRYLNLIDKLNNFSFFEQLAKIRITHKVLGLIFVIGLAVTFTSTIVWRGIAPDTKEIETTLQISEYDVNNLDNYNLTTDLNNSSVEVKYGLSDKVVVTFHNTDDADIEYTETTNGLIIQDKSVTRWFDNTSAVDWLITLMQNDFNYTGSSMVIEVPIGMTFSELDFETSNGEIVIDEITGSLISAYSTNGEITISDINASILSIAAVNGEITVTDLFATEVFIESVNGSISIDNLNTPENDGEVLIITLVNGEINVVNTYLLDVTLEAVNGDIEYYNDDNSYILDYLEMTTVNGQTQSNANYKR